MSQDLRVVRFGYWEIMGTWMSWLGNIRVDLFPLGRAR